MKRLSLLAVLASSVFLGSIAKAWDVNNWMDRSSAETCYQLVQTAGYYSAKYYSTGNSQFKSLADKTIAKAKSRGCK